MRVFTGCDRASATSASLGCSRFPDCAGASFGTYNVLWQLRQCRELGLAYLYLGYWIENSPKMAYKAAFRPVETLHQGHWIGLEHVAG